MVRPIFILYHYFFIIVYCKDILQNKKNTIDKNKYLN